MDLKQQGVNITSLPTKKSLNVVPANFEIGGMIGIFPRKFEVAFPVTSYELARLIFGDQKNVATYGHDTVKGFFDNIVGVSAELYIKSNVGNDGSGNIDGVSAVKTVDDDGSENSLQINSAYQENLDYSFDGNSSAFTIETGKRFETAIKTASLPADTFIDLGSVADVKIGDIITVEATGTAPETVSKKVTAKDESTGRVSFSGIFHATSYPDVDDDVYINGFKIHTWRRSVLGAEKEVDEARAALWCSTESDVVDYFVENIFEKSSYFKVDYLDSSSVPGDRQPVANATLIYLIDGVDGTAPTTIAHWNPDLVAFDNLPIRMIGNGETVDTDIQKAIETYCRGREDLPKVIYNFPENQTEAQLIELGHDFQRSDDVLGVIVANWYAKPDPFSSSSTAPKRNVPSIGHTMGAWIRSIKTLGIHSSPAVGAIPIFGVSGIVGDQLLDNTIRTRVASAGVNVVQKITGSGIVMASFYTPSNTKEFFFAQGILMREFIKISIQQSLKKTANEPNTFDRIQSSKSAINKFYKALWTSGSNNKVATGETFGQTFDPETNEATKYEDHVKIQVDFKNNPQSAVESGERNLWSWFSYPSSAGSIEIGTGFLLLG